VDERGEGGGARVGVELLGIMGVELVAVCHKVIMRESDSFWLFCGAGREMDGGQMTRCIVVVRDWKLLVIQKVVRDMLDSSNFLNHSHELWFWPIYRFFGQEISGMSDALDGSLKSLAICNDVLWL
jgi:hypothetical protein